MRGDGEKENPTGLPLNTPAMRRYDYDLLNGDITEAVWYCMDRMFLYRTGILSITLNGKKTVKVPHIGRTSKMPYLYAEWLAHYVC